MSSVISAAAAAGIVTIFIILVSYINWEKKRRAKRRMAQAKKRTGSSTVKTGKHGDPQVCPICLAIFEHGENIKSTILPDTGKPERVMNIHGCPHCMEGGRSRTCPVCGEEIAVNEYLSARVYRTGEKTHVHVVGCNHCMFGSKGKKRKKRR